MDLLVKAVKVVDSRSPLHGKVLDLLIQDGKIAKFGSELSLNGVQTVEEDGLCCSVGWFDLNAFSGEPGYEHRETLDRLVKAAAFGGFTEVACLPNLAPVTETRSAVQFLKNSSNGRAVTLHPLAAVTHHLQGNDLAELVDLHESGAIAFTDGIEAIQQADTILKALEYLKLFNGVLINKAENKRLANAGQMHEGVASTRLGLKGIPAIAEETQVTRDLQLVSYTGGRLHFSQLSTAGAIEAVRAAKKQGLQVTCDVASYQCAFTDETLLPFDTNYKVSPPFRGEADKEALLQAMQDGTIDALVSAHMPWDVEAKELEFDLAEAGIINLQTAFAVALQTTRPQIELARVVEMLTIAPRKVVNLASPALEEGAKANLTFFHPEKKWNFTEELNASLSRNSPFLKEELEGCVYGTYHNGQLTLNPAYAQ